MSTVSSERETFVAKLRALPTGYVEGTFNKRRYGATRTVSADGRREKFYAAALGGNDVVSFNLYILRGGERLLRPCEMPEAKVIAFVVGFVVDVTASATGE